MDLHDDRIKELRQLFPGPSPEQLEQYAAALERYVELVLRVFEDASGT